MLLLIFISVCLILVNFLIQRFNKNEKILDDNLPYMKKKYLLTLNEKNFYEILKLTIKDTNYYICPMVRVADVIYVDRKKTDKWQYHFNKIVGKHIDFLLCDRETMTPLVAIELDDKSHERQDRIERDKFLNNAFQSAGIKLIRFKTNKSYNLSNIKEKLSGCWL